MDDQKLPGGQNGSYKYLRLFMDDTVPRVPAWRFTRFPDLPDELQVMIWEMALESELNDVPRIISVSTFLPPAREIHVARVLAQTCVKSREVALKCLAKCEPHEDNHRFYSETAEELRFSDLRIVAQSPTRRLPPRSLHAPAAVRGQEKGETDRLKNPLHNHVHIDRDYLLFTGLASKVLRLTTLEAQAFVHGVQKVMVPSTVLWSLFSQSMFGDLDMGQNLLKTAKEVVILLPISMEHFLPPSLSNPSRYPNLSASSFLARILKDVAHRENQRWAQASEVPYNLIRFWTDEEMAAFAASCLERQKYQPWSHDTMIHGNPNPNLNTNTNPNPANNALPLWATNQNLQGPNGNQNLISVMSLLQQNGFLSNSPAPATGSASNTTSSLASPTPSISGTTTPDHSKPFVSRVHIFREMQETNSLLYGLFQCWKALFTPAEGGKMPMIRFAHVKGSETDKDLQTFLTRFNGAPEKECGLDWQDYIPAQSSEEIKSEVVHRQSPLTNVKMSQRYSATGQFEVETLSGSTEDQSTWKPGASGTSRASGPADEFGTAADDMWSSNGGT
ncbi:hypothetical protein QBC40DRAFT_81468 [Triangularia verruculosa]|uniref:2EXR domain-containing protein n=1 Tax=Triangularia verruculosa TaxID=2587418 RepID=A0AAN6XH76_9PEZI|nr:hypothetical protein QBC40DRAFT_81468 [Triangularia verruculosa]